MHFAADYWQRLPPDLHPFFTNHRDYWPSLFVGGPASFSGKIRCMLHALPRYRSACVRCPAGDVETGTNPLCSVSSSTNVCHPLHAPRLWVWSSSAYGLGGHASMDGIDPR